MSEELKPCPFCGSEGELYKREKWYSREFDVRCINSECGTHFTGFNVSEWNARHIPEGFALVPIKPTYEMRKASTYWNDMYLGGHESPEEFNVEIYHAMITTYQEGK